MRISFGHGLSVTVVVACGLSHSVAWADDFRGVGIHSPSGYSFARALSADGLTMTGDATVTDGTQSWVEAYVWSPATGFTRLGYLGESQSGNRQSFAWDISADGTVVVGESSNTYMASGTLEAFKWTRGVGMEGLGFLDTYVGEVFGESRALGVSADGTVVVGQSTNNDGTVTWKEAVIWSGGTKTALGVLGDIQVNVGDDITPIYEVRHGNSSADYISTDGTMVAGHSDNDNGTDYWSEAFAYEFGGTRIDFMEGTHGQTGGSDVRGVSDAGVVVGNGTNTDGSLTWKEGYAWSAGPGLQRIGWLGDGPSGSHGYSAVWGVSGDGSTVVGYSSMTDATYAWEQAFTWDSTSQNMRALDLLPSGSVASVISYSTYVSHGYATTPDGGVIVGSALEDMGGGTVLRQAVIWDGVTGTVQSIHGLLENSGVDTTGWHFQLSYGISDDGEIVAGSGYNPDGSPEAWYFSKNAIITPTIIEASFAALSDMAQKETAAADGAVGLELLLAGRQCGDAADWGDKRYCFFGRGTGTLGDDDAGSTGGSLGVAMQLMDDYTVGVSLQLGAGSKNIAEAGYYEAQSAGATAFASYAPESGFRASGAIAFAGSSFDVTRGYFNANAPVSSYGETEGGTVAATVKLGWRVPVTTELALTPFASYSASRFHVDGWTESGGPFPAVIEPIEQTSQVARLGLEGQLDLDPSTTLWALAAIAHRFESHGAAVSGEIVGITSATTHGVQLEQDWAEVAIGADHALDAYTTLSAAVGANSMGGLSATVGYSVHF